MSVEPDPDIPSGDEVLIPRHVAIIMDGNGRWAQTRGLPRSEGHRRGVEAVKRAAQFAGDNGIKYLTLFSFSSENWSRPQAEIDDLLNLLRYFIRRDLNDLNRNNVKIRLIGSRKRIPEDILEMISRAETDTAGNTGLNLVVAFNYGSRDEIVRAATRFAERVASGEAKPDALTEAEFERHLDTSGIPDPDLIIRTSGEQRISNFLLWQAAYSEMLFLPVFWPDFTDRDFEEALKDFASRDRRYGGVRNA
ncbi:MAG TPA: isoprenyl transferase [Afifellaceae bacterium]|nr:isoprenyl transferase [Afifellaceae bacterium]